MEIFFYTIQPFPYFLYKTLSSFIFCNASISSHFLCTQYSFTCFNLCLIILSIWLYLKLSWFLNCLLWSTRSGIYVAIHDLFTIVLLLLVTGLECVSRVTVVCSQIVFYFSTKPIFILVLIVSSFSCGCASVASYVFTSVFVVLW